MYALPLERRLGLGHEGADTEGEAQPCRVLLQGQQQVGRGVHVIVRLRWQSDHSIQLESTEPPLFGVTGGRMDLFGAQFLVHHLPHAFAAAFDGDGEGAIAPLRQNPCQLRSHRGGPHGTDADAGVIEPVPVQPGQQIIELRVLRHRGSQQPKPAGRRQAFLDRRDESVIE